MTVFDFDDLTEDSLLILCIKPQFTVPGHEHDQHKVITWHGSEFDYQEANNEVVNVQEFTQRVMEQYWGCKSPEN